MNIGSVAVFYSYVSITEWLIVMKLIVYNIFDSCRAVGAGPATTRVREPGPASTPLTLHPKKISKV